MAKKKLTVTISRVKLAQLEQDLTYYQDATRQAWDQYHRRGAQAIADLERERKAFAERAAETRRMNQESAYRIDVQHRAEVEVLKSTIRKLQTVAKHSVDQIVGTNW